MNYLHTSKCTVPQINWKASKNRTPVVSRFKVLEFLFICSLSLVHAWSRTENKRLPKRMGMLHIPYKGILTGTVCKSASRECVCIECIQKVTILAEIYVPPYLFFTLMLPG